jgi:hypothetical protein
MRRGIAGLVGALALLAGTSYGGDRAFKSFLPDDAYKQLVQREAKIVQDNLKTGDEDKLTRARVGALMIQGYAASHVKPADGAHAHAIAALGLGKAIRDKKLDEARKMAEALATGTSGSVADTKLDWRADLDLKEIMDPLKVQSKGGDGIAPELQVNIRLKGALNGIEEKIRNLAVKKLNEPVLDKANKELALLGYRMAVLAEITHEFPPPKKGKGSPKEWQTLSIEMRDAGIEMAQAAHTKNAEALFKAATRLNSSCTQCHNSFR